jgi:hypothetical protein
MAFSVSELWSWHGTVGRGKYFTIGVILFAVKHNIDRIVATAAFGRPWSIFNYWIIDEPGNINRIPYDHLTFYGTLIAIAIPFIWVGVVLTLKRLRSIGLPLWLTAFFFFPFINLFFFLLLSVLPARAEDLEGGLKSGPSLSSGFRSVVSRILPDSATGSAAMGVFVTVILSIGATVLSVRAMGNYGWSLFVGLPFFLGLTSVLIYGFHRPRSLISCLAVSVCSVALVCAAIFALAIEGAICLIMAAPIGLVLALVGGLIGYAIQHRPSFSHEAFHAFSLLVLAIPAFILLEGSAKLEPPLRMVRTSVEVAAPPERVWEHLVEFAELPPPTERLFHTGIAYPVRAEIEGTGAGAVRHCVFSTGAFVEPIEVWDQPNLLKFGVSAQPPVMDEMSPYPHLTPPHLDGYLQSRKGQFLLTRLPNGNTLLEGTTWYQNSFWPGLYWNIWSDYIIHRIHQRVLDHIKKLAEE